MKRWITVTKCTVMHHQVGKHWCDNLFSIIKSKFVCVCVCVVRKHIPVWHHCSVRGSICFHFYPLKRLPCPVNIALNSARKIMMHDNRGTVVFTGCASCNPWLLNFVTNDSNKTHTVLQKKKEIISIIYARSFKNWKYPIMVQKINHFTAECC